MNTPDGPNYNAGIEKDKNGGNFYKVKKLHVRLGSSEPLAWQAPGDTAVTIMFPPGADPLKIGTITLMPGDVYLVDLSAPRDIHWHKEHPSRIPGSPVKDKFAYRYAIYCHSTRNFAVMDSDPEIIIEGEG